MTGRRGRDAGSGLADDGSTTCVTELRVRRPDGIAERLRFVLGRPRHGGQRPGGSVNPATGCTHWFTTGTRNGVFAVFAGVNASNISRSTGFRCAR